MLAMHAKHSMIYSAKPFLLDKPGETVLLLGNEAIARGAIEAGVHFAAAYPGTPSSEILESLALASKRFGFYAEWSTNEMVAVEAAAAAAWAGLRAITSMKQNGLNVIMDFITNLSFTGSGKGGLVIVVGDDPHAYSSTNEQDSRPLGKFAEIPVLEPSLPQEAKDMMIYALELSERFNLPVLVRSTTRLGHSRGDVKLGEIKKLKRKAVFNREQPFYNLPRPHLKHEALHKKANKIRSEFEKSTWNRYEGPEKPSLLIIASGVAWTYAKEAVEILGLKDAGILKLGTVFPLPTELIKNYLSRAKEVLFVEEIEPYLEENIRSIAAETGSNDTPKFYGKLTGHLPSWGELNPDKVANALSKIKNINFNIVSSEYEKKITEFAAMAPRRRITLCPGCPHIASYWSIMQAIRKNKNRGFVTGDIGCYTIGVFYNNVLNSVHCMGAGAGLASGFGQLHKFGLEEPVIAVMGDSTFYHACIPALINIIYNNANATICILDNEATAMTGFQPHPGTGTTAAGDEAPKIKIEEIAKGIGFKNIKIIDPFNFKEAIKAVYEAITTPGGHIIIFRRKCTLIARREMERAGIKIPRYAVDQAKCAGETCGICSRLFSCPACIWDTTSNKAQIDTVLCNGCGACVAICPYKAIYKMED
jgi:indolepyruvate ferredoxin oxidoreductase alpha subunit